MKDYFEAKILIIEMSRKDISLYQKFLLQMDQSLPSLLMDVSGLKSCLVCLRNDDDPSVSLDW